MTPAGINVLAWGAVLFFGALLVSLVVRLVRQQRDRERERHRRGDKFGGWWL
jgi:hypothetical protein